MSVLFSKSCEYALKAVLYLGTEPREHQTTLEEISHALHIPYHFLGKVLQLLVKHGVVESHKGINGGFSLKRPANKIMLIEVIRAIDGDVFLEGCVLGFDTCSSDNPCPLHDYWKHAKEILSIPIQTKSVDVFSKLLELKMKGNEHEPVLSEQA